MTLILSPQPIKLGIQDFNNPLDLPIEVVSQVRSHMQECFPNEGCGLIVNNKWEPAENISPEPKISWEVDADWQSNFDQEDIQGVIHSHVKGQDQSPSKLDMQGQIESQLPWAIVEAHEDWAGKPLWWGDYRLDEPLNGRIYVHGISDCYSCIRSWYWQRKGLYLDDFPRDQKWWEDDGPNHDDMYSLGIGKYGVRVAREELVIGDVALFKFLNKVASHAAIVVEDGLMYHHLADTLSGTVPLGRFQRYAIGWWHYTGGAIPREEIEHV